MLEGKAVFFTWQDDAWPRPAVDIMWRPEDVMWPMSQEDRRGNKMGSVSSSQTLKAKILLGSFLGLTHRV